MQWVDILGWIGTLVGGLMGVPQLVRLFRTRNVDGLSTATWQAWTATAIAWAVHGVRIGQAPQVTTSVLVFASAIPIVYLMARELDRGFVRLLLPGLAGGLLLILIDVTWGSAAFGLVSLIPMLVVNIGQSLELIRSPHVDGVSVVTIAMLTLNQTIWTVWSFAINDPASMLSAASGLFFAGFNLIWYGLRRLGLRPFFPHAPVGHVHAES